MIGCSANLSLPVAAACQLMPDSNWHQEHKECATDFSTCVTTLLVDGDEMNCFNPTAKSRKPEAKKVLLDINLPSHLLETEMLSLHNLGT